MKNTKTQYTAEFFQESRDPVGNPRYTMVLEPFDGFMVFDEFLDQIAEMGDHAFMGLSEEEALHACRTLNALHDRKQAADDTVPEQAFRVR